MPTPSTATKNRHLKSPVAINHFIVPGGCFPEMKFSPGIWRISKQSLLCRQFGCLPSNIPTEVSLIGVPWVSLFTVCTYKKLSLDHNDFESSVFYLGFKHGQIRRVAFN